MKNYIEPHYQKLPGEKLHLEYSKNMNNSSVIQLLAVRKHIVTIRVLQLLKGNIGLCSYIYNICIHICLL